MEYKIRKTSSGKIYSKCKGETSARPVYKKSELSISINQQFENVKKFVSTVCISRGLIKCVKN